ncbi:MAG: T9SS C-terminal target domain-containing protein [Haliscomenobacteraceae bacterium CHB4]|nr:T9SS C-terminal target domain-containing protein [Haliscomenobacteraceae bacterium CHB4]
MKHIAVSLLLLGHALSAIAQTPVPQMIQDIHLPAEHPFEYVGANISNAHGNVIFEGHTTIYESGIWSYDGNAATLIDDGGYGFWYLKEAENGFFYIKPYDNDKYWLRKYEGSPGISRLIDDFTSTPVTALNEIAVLHEKVFYRKTEPATGLELWSADGTPGSGALLKDCNPGPAGSYPFNFTIADSLMYFRAGSNGKQIWRTDGTPDGTFLLFEANIPVQWIMTGSLKSIGNRLYFMLLHPQTDAVEIWKSDGTTAGTVKVSDVPPAEDSPVTFRVAVLGNKYIYMGYDPVLSCREWIAFDIETLGIETLFDITVPNSYNPVLFKNDLHPVLNNEFYFFYRKTDGGNLVELWKTDGTTAGTIKVKTLDNFTVVPLSPSKLRFFFLVYKYNNDGDDIELWSSDGTETGTQLAKYLGKSYYVGYQIPSAATDSAVCFRHPIFGPGLPDLIVRSDGTESGTFFPNGIPASWLEDASPSGFTAGPGGSVFFRANHEFDRDGIWRTETDSPFGSIPIDTAQTVYYHSIDNPKSTSEKVFWFLSDSVLSMSGSGDTITRIPLPVKYDGLYGYSASVVNDNIFYFLVDNGRAIWRSDGTTDGTFELLTLPGSNLTDLITAGDSIFFVQTFTGLNQPYYLWTTDGTIGGSYNLGQINADGNLDNLLEINGYLVYSTYSISPAARNLHVRNFASIPFPGYIYNEFSGLEIIVDRLFIFGPPFNDGISFKYFLWSFQNGQLELLKDFASVTGYFITPLGIKDRLVGLGEKVIFGAGMTTDNLELWTSDGTSGGTYELRDINPFGSSNPDNFVRFDDAHWLFTAFDGATTAWWATDGTTVGTFKVADLTIGSNYLVPNVENTYLYQNRLYFSMNDGVHGQEPWVMVLGDSLTVGVITPLQAASDMVIWPNPTASVLYLSLEAPPNEAVTIEIINGYGVTVQRQEFFPLASNPLQVSLGEHLTSGLYFLRATTAGGKSRVKGFVLNR